MCLPALKVPNEPGIANQRWPTCLQGHHRVVNADWEEDSGALLAFPCQGGFDFLFDPLTCHRRLGQDEEQLVIEADGLVNAGAEVVTDFHIFWGKPAAHALVLEIRIEAFGEGVVFTRIADKTGVELDPGISTESVDAVEDVGYLARCEALVIELSYFNLPIVQTTASEKSQEKRPGLGEGAMVEGAGASVVAGL